MIEHTNNVTKHRLTAIALSVIAGLSLSFLCNSCIEDNPNLPDTLKRECSATLNLSVGAFDGNPNSRAAMPGNADENLLNNIWVFQFDSETGIELHSPVYLNAFDSEDIPVSLTANSAGKKSLVCIVANAGTTPFSGTGTWALNSDGTTRTGFETFSGLKKQYLSPKSAGSFLSSVMGTSGNAIPMFGVSKPIAIDAKSYVSIPLTRMFARLDITVPSASLPSGLTVTNISVESIPIYSQTELVSQGWTYVTPVAYPKITWTTKPLGKATPLTLYLPENLQGKVTTMTSKQSASTGFPVYATRVKVTVSYTNAAGASATHTYTVYPGDDMINDFNIRRNRIYSVTIKITKRPS